MYGQSKAPINDFTPLLTCCFNCVVNLFRISFQCHEKITRVKPDSFPVSPHQFRPTSSPQLRQLITLSPRTTLVVVTNAAVLAVTAAVDIEFIAHLRAMNNYARCVPLG